MISHNVGGFTKKTFTTAVIFPGYCIVNIVGPHFLFGSEAPRYKTGTTAMLISYVIKTVCHLTLEGYMLRSNIKRDRECGKVTPQGQLEGEEAGMRDLTEFENRYHRYVL